MPTYTYACSRCGEFELEQSIRAPALTSCPTCEGAVERLVSGGGGFIIKGQGASASRCERSEPCCGRATRCDSPPCRG